MLKNVKFNFEDDHFSTVFLILVSVGWFSLTMSGPSSNSVSAAPATASVSTNLSASVTPKAVAKTVAKVKKQEELKARSIASVEDKPSEQMSARAVKELRSMTNRINDKAGSVVVSYDDAGPIEKLHVNADFILLTDRRPRVSSDKSRIVAPAIIAFSIGKKVVAYIDHAESTPTTHIDAIEKYIKSYNNLQVERRLLTTVQNQLELTLEVQ